MSSSVDYRAYCEASARECERFSRVYLGYEDDQTPFTEHFTVDHLDQLLSGALSPALRTLYMQEYTELRTSLRATAEALMSRKDYYFDAAAKRVDEATLLRNSVTFNEQRGTQLVAALDEPMQQTLADLETQYIDRKNEVISRLQAGTGFNGEATPTPEEVVRNAMAQTPGVNNKGVALDATRFA